MPTFEIGLNDGRTLHIDADDQNAALAGAQHFMSASQPSGALAGLVHGAMGVPEGIANTASVYGGNGDTSQTPDQGYVPAQVIPQNGHWYDPTSYNWSQVPQAVSEALPGLATDVAAARTGAAMGGAVGGAPGGLIGGAVGGIGSYLMRTRGDAAKADAQIRTGDANAKPNDQDKVRSLATGAVEALPQALHVAPFMGGVAKAGASTLGRLAGTTAIEGGTGAAMNAVSQAGATIGTPSGMQVDPNQVAAAGLTSAATGGALAIPRAVTDARTASVFQPIDGNSDLAPAAAGFANRVQQAAGGRNLSNPSVGGDAFLKARSGVMSELGDAAKDASSRVDLPPDAQNVLNFIQRGQTPTSDDYNTLTSALGNDPQAANLLHLAQQAHVSNLVANTGHIGDDGSFTGGMAQKVASMSGLTGHSAGKAIVGSMLAEHLGSHLITYNPESLGLVAGAYGLTRLGDRMSGARSPANRFVQRYADPNSPMRLDPTAQAPDPTQAPQAPTGPTGSVPSVPPLPTPWGAEPPQQVPQSPAIDPLNLPSSITSPAKNLMSALQKAQTMRAAAQPQAAAPDQPVDPLNLPRDLTGPAKNLMSGLQKAQALREAAQPQVPPEDPQVAQRAQIKDAMDLMAARRANTKLVAQQQSQASQEQNSQYAAADQASAAYDRMIRQQAKDATDLMAARRANGQQANQQTQQQVTDATSLMAARRAGAQQAQQAGQQQARDATELMAARLANIKAFQQREAERQATIGKAKAESLAKSSPLIEDAGGMGAVSNPAFTKQAGAYIAAANAIKRLTAQPQEAAPAAAPVAPATPETPAPVLVDRIKKKAGKAQVEAHTAPADSGSDDAYVPLTPEQMPYKGLGPKQIADIAAPQYVKQHLDPLNAKIEKTQRMRLETLSNLADKHPADEDHIADLLEQLKHLTRSDRADIPRAINHYASMMTPEGAAATRRVLGKNFIRLIWGE